MISNEPMRPAERRRYFRIDDAVSLKYRIVDDAELELAIGRFQVGYPDKLSLASAFASTSSQMRLSIDQFRREMPEVASYLEGLNEKLDLLVQMLAASDEDLADRPTHGVTLSASGLSFETPDRFELGANLELKFLVFPTYVCVLCFGTVMRCREMTTEPGDGVEPRYDVGVDFSHIREADRELIFKHVTKRQSQLLREAKTVLDNGE